jgi:GNAT superfamily N-acetyltransferase
VGDAAHWLRLQSVALPSSQAGRDWTDRDFAREFLSQSWWSPERMLFAATASGRTVGTATLGGRGGQEVHSEATVHWLLVDPEYQRRGVATTLVAQLEWMCWEAGGRSMTLETLSIWEAAVAFYVARGYVVTS